MGLLQYTTTAVALLAALGNGTPTPEKRGYQPPKFPFGSEKVRGVNLGGWFVLEPWITPSIFEAAPPSVVDEYTYTQHFGKTEAKRRLNIHWANYYTEADFALMAQYGLNMVRIPIGYWSIMPLAGDPYVQGAYAYLGKAVGWAGKYGIKVMIDLHGAPLSQNGFDNSGRRGAIGWTQNKSVANTLMSIRKIRNDFAENPAVAAIQLVNEPFGPSLNLNTIAQFYYDGWGILQNNSVAVTIHDAFEGPTYWNSWGSGLWNVLVDTHHYEVFDSGSLAQSPSQHVSTACAFGNTMTGSNKWIISGEWTGAMTDCAKWLNGRGYGARYDGTFNKDGQGSSYIGSCAGFRTGTVAGLSATAKQNIKTFIQAQMAAFEKNEGWIFWTWKNEAAPEWHFKNLTQAGLIAQPLSNAAASGICG